MNPDFIVLTLALIFNTVLSGFIFLRNPKGRVNQMFAVFGVIIALWTIFNFAADHASSQNLLFSRLTLLFGSGVVAALFVLCTLFPKPKRRRRSWAIFYALSLANFILCMTPLYVPSVTKTAHGAELSVGSLYTLFVVYILMAIIWSMVVLLRLSKPQSLTERSQVRLFALGIIIYTTFAFLSNVILPIIINNWSSSRFGPIFTIPFVAVISYAIVKHRLFDMRLALTRTAGFVITIGVLSALYSMLILGVGVPLITNGQVSFVRNDIQLLLFLPPTILVALTFHSLQRLIAKTTEGIFYQDSYDTRTVLDKLSDALISDNDINKIMPSGLAVLYDALKPAHALFIVLDDKGKIYRQQLTGRDQPEQIDTLVAEARQFKERVAAKDDSVSGRWPKEFEHEDISLVLRLGTVKNTIGVLFLGPKQNGRIYTRQDTGLMSVSAKNFGIAIENAKKYEQISAFADTMHREVLRATANLRHANAELKTLDSMKDDFISMASHQLRSPATSVHEALQMLNQLNIEPEERQKLIELAEASSERLVTVITDMLSIARIQAGHFSIEKTEIDLAELADRAILEASGIARQHTITVYFDRPDPVKLQADRAKVNEMMSNYVENAINYSPDGSTIMVSLKKTKDRVHFEVQDSGIGVPPSERKDLFRKFFRATNARKDQPNGNGIGLFVVKSVAQAHGGDAYYEPLEKGSLFGFWLPL